TADAQPPTADREQPLARLNPDYGAPADTHNPHGHQALRDREAALALGTRVAVASSRENDRQPIMWLARPGYPTARATPPGPAAPAPPPPAAARTTGSRSCGWPARTTEPPTPPAPPIASWSGAAVVRNGSAPNANPTTHPIKQGAQLMAADNQTTIAGNLVDTPEL